MQYEPERELIHSPFESFETFVLLSRDATALEREISSFASILTNEIIIIIIIIYSKAHCTLSPKFSSEMFARWKINTTSRYVNHVYTLPQKSLAVIKKLGSASIFCVFRIHGKHFERCFDSSEPPYKRMPKSRMSIVKFIHFISQHKALCKSLHTEFTKIVDLPFNMWF